MPNNNNDAANGNIPEHLGGAPTTIGGWIQSYLSWILFNVVYGFAIIVAGIAAWFQLDSGADAATIVAIYKSLALSILVWSTTVLLSSAEISTAHSFMPWKGGLKSSLMGLTLIIVILTAVFVAGDPPDWKSYATNTARNERLFVVSIWGTVICLGLAAIWHNIQRRAKDLEMRFRDSGYHDDFQKKLEEMSDKAKARSHAGGLKIN